MDWLKEILGEELYNQLVAALNAHNGKPENREKQVKLADLGKGEYVSKENIPHWRQIKETLPNS